MKEFCWALHISLRTLINEIFSGLSEIFINNRGISSRVKSISRPNPPKVGGCFGLVSVFRFGPPTILGRFSTVWTKKLIENAVNISIELFHRTKYRWNLYKNVARSLTFLTKLLVGFYHELKNLHEYFSIREFPARPVFLWLTWRYLLPLTEHPV